MKLLELYLELVEKESRRVSSAWKNCQITLYVASIVASFIAYICFTNALNGFNGNCMLFSDVSFVSGPLNCSQPEVNPFDAARTEWGDIGVCMFVQYVPVFSVIFSFPWAVLFTMCGTGGKTAKGLPQPWRIVYPALVFNIVFFFIAMASAVMLDKGYDTFCHSFTSNMNETSCRDVDKYCFSSQHVLRITYAEAASWCSMVVWLLAALLLVLRCIFVADFDVIKVTIQTPEPDHDWSSSRERDDWTNPRESDHEQDTQQV
ncbi:transmembrane protein 179B isoform X2 [Bacillus rossius redtenbacheri]|uniref:transmembrane protein 179B isoform X2 n=1 Tax=Bacillus rossius redtenbacheri TaxID=93214 RepID=UPI002FDD49D0